MLHDKLLRSFLSRSYSLQQGRSKQPDNHVSQNIDINLESVSRKHQTKPHNSYYGFLIPISSFSNVVIVFAQEHYFSSIPNHIILKHFNVSEKEVIITRKADFVVLDFNLSSLAEKALRKNNTRMHIPKEKESSRTSTSRNHQNNQNQHNIEQFLNRTKSFINSQQYQQDSENTNAFEETFFADEKAEENPISTKSRFDFFTFLKDLFSFGIELTIGVCPAICQQHLFVERFPENKSPFKYKQGIKELLSTFMEPHEDLINTVVYNEQLSSFERFLCILLGWRD